MRRSRQEAGRWPHLQVGLVLNELLCATVQQADVGVCALHHLALHLQHQPQHAVSGRVLRAEVDGEVLNLGRGQGLVDGGTHTLGQHALGRVGAGQHLAELWAIIAAAGGPAVDRKGLVHGA